MCFVSFAFSILNKTTQSCASHRRAAKREEGRKGRGLPPSSLTANTFAGIGNSQVSQKQARRVKRFSNEFKFAIVSTSAFCVREMGLDLCRGVCMCVSVGVWGRGWSGVGCACKQFGGLNESPMRRFYAAS